MIDEKEFSLIKEDLTEFDNQREDIIACSREITRSSKQAISALHRNDTKQATLLLKSAEELVKKLGEIVHKKPELLGVGAYGACLQEYAEAKCYFGYVIEHKIPTRKEISVDSENYLLGVCDLTGELERRSVHSVINGNISEVQVIWEVVNSIYEKFLSFDLKNGELRKKSDSIKWNLKRIEEILYDLKIRKKDGLEGVIVTDQLLHHTMLSVTCKKKKKQ